MASTSVPIIDVRVRKLLPEERPWFESAAREEIAKDYDDIDETFAENIANAHSEGFDPLGYFTLEKTIWVGEYGGEPFGFLVTTRKRGNSVKLGPHVTTAHNRMKGLGSSLRELVIEELRLKGIRKIYVDMPANRSDMVAWDLKRKMQIEAHLREHYRPGIDEIVMGRFLFAPTYPLIHFPECTSKIKPTSIRLAEGKDKELWGTLLATTAGFAYAEFDATFVDAVFASKDRIAESFRRKGRFPIIFETSSREPIGVAVVVPKRGGAVKIGPVALHHDVDCFHAVDILRGWLSSHAVSHGWRRFYALTPLGFRDLVMAFSTHLFLPEGLIRSPYKDGVDVVVQGTLMH